jgi:hypothetical protein
MGFRLVGECPLPEGMAAMNLQKNLLALPFGSAGIRTSQRK